MVVSKTNLFFILRCSPQLIFSNSGCDPWKNPRLFYFEFLLKSLLLTFLRLTTFPELIFCYKIRNSSQVKRNIVETSLYFTWRNSKVLLKTAGVCYKGKEKKREAWWKLWSNFLNFCFLSLFIYFVDADRTIRHSKKNMWFPSGSSNIQVVEAVSM